MNKLFKRLDKKNVKELRQELALAHFIIALFSISIIGLLVLGATAQTALFDAQLSVICVTLLVIVTIISLGLSIILLRKK